MSAEEILNNKSTYYSLTQEFNLSDTLTKLIKEELEINNSSNDLFNINICDDLSTLQISKNSDGSKPTDFKITSCFKSSSNPWKLGACKKHRRISKSKRNLILNESVKCQTNELENDDVDLNCHLADDHNYHMADVSYGDTDNKEVDSSEFIVVQKKYDFSDPILEKNNQRAVNTFCNLTGSTNPKNYSSNLEKEINELCDNVKNKNILSASIISEINNDSNVITRNNKNELKLIDENISIPVAQEINIETDAVDNLDNVDQEFIIEEEIIANDKPVCDVKNNDFIPISSSLKGSLELIAVDNNPGGSDKETGIEEEIITNNEPVCDVQNNDVVSMPTFSEENHEPIAVDNNSGDSGEETVIEEEFIIENGKLVCCATKENTFLAPITLEETAVEDVNSSDPETVFEEEFIIDELKEESVVPTAKASNEPAVDNNPDPKTVSREEFTINNNELNCILKKENVVPTKKTSKLNNESTVNDSKLEQKTVIGKKLLINNNSRPIYNVRSKNVAPVLITQKKINKIPVNNFNNLNQETVREKELAKNNNKKSICDLKKKNTILTGKPSIRSVEITFSNSNSDQKAVIEEELTIDGNKLNGELKKENVFCKTLKNNNEATLDYADSDHETVLEEEFTIDDSEFEIDDGNELINNLEGKSFIPTAITVKESEEITADNANLDPAIVEEFFVNNNSKPICNLKGKSMIPILLTPEKNNETAVNNLNQEGFTISRNSEPACNSKRKNMSSILKNLLITPKKNNTAVDDFNNLDKKTVIDEELNVGSNKPICDLRKENTISIPITSEENVETTADNFGNLYKEVVIEEEYFLNEPVFNEEIKNEARQSMKQEENYEETAGDNVGLDQEVIIEEEIIINDFIDDLQNEDAAIPTVVENTCDSREEAIRSLIRDLEDEDILPMPIDLMDNTVFNNLEDLEIDKDLENSIGEILNEDIFAVPISPEKRARRNCERKDPLHISPVKGLNKNLLENLPPLSLEGLNSDEEYDKLCNEKLLNSSENVKQRSICTDSEFERMCDTIKNTNEETERFSFETIELLNEFDGIDQSTNEKLLADLLESPEVDPNTSKKQDYLITVDPLIDHSTSIGSVSDTSDDGDLGIEVKSRHIKKMIKNNAERKKFFKMQKKSVDSQKSTSAVENEDEFDKRKKRSKYKKGEINYNEDTDDSIDYSLPIKRRKSEVKPKCTKEKSGDEGRRNSRFSKKSNKENSQDNQDDCVNNVNSQNTCKKLPIIRLRRINGLKPKDFNQENGKNPENDFWIMNFDPSINENEQNSIENNKISETNDKTAEEDESVTKKFFSDDESQKIYDQLTDLLMITNDHLPDKLITDGVVDAERESLGEKSLDDKGNDHENIMNLESLIERNGEQNLGSEIKQTFSPGKSADSAKLEEQSCDLQGNLEDHQPTEVSKESRLQETSFVGRKIKMSEKMKEFLGDTQSDVDEKLVSSSTEKCSAKKSPSKLKGYKSKELPTSSSDDKVMESHTEVSDITDDCYDSGDSSSSFSSRMRVKSRDTKSRFCNVDIDKITDETAKKLISLKIKLEHKVPKQHRLETHLAQCITPKLKKAFSKYAKLQKGRFKPREIQIIQRNWKRFLEVHNLDPSCKQLLIEKYNNYRSIVALMKEKVKFIQFLARDLPNRLLTQIYKRFLASLSETEKPKSGIKNKKTKVSPFSHEDDELIMSRLDQDEANTEENVKELSELLNRPESMILKRFNTLQSRKIRMDVTKNRKGRWDISFAETFIKNLMDLTLSETINELKYAEFPHCVWSKMENRLNIDYKKLKRFWSCQLHIQLFSSKCVFSNDLRIMLIEYLYVKGISDEKEIDWEDMTDHFEDGVTTEYLKTTFSQMYYFAHKYNPDKTSLECIEWMYTTKLPIIIKTRLDTYLPRLIYKDGKLEFIDDDSNEIIEELESD